MRFDVGLFKLKKQTNSASVGLEFQKMVVAIFLIDRCKEVFFFFEESPVVVVDPLIVAVIFL